MNDIIDIFKIIIKLPWAIIGIYYIPNGTTFKKRKSDKSGMRFRIRQNRKMRIQ